MSWIQGGGEALQRVHVVRPPHLLHQELHLNLKNKNIMVINFGLSGWKNWLVW